MVAIAASGMILASCSVLFPQSDLEDDVDVPSCEIVGECDYIEDPVLDDPCLVYNCDGE